MAVIEAADHDHNRSVEKDRKIRSFDPIIGGPWLLMVCSIAQRERSAFGDALEALDDDESKGPTSADGRRWRLRRIEQDELDQFPRDTAGLTRIASAAKGRAIARPLREQSSGGYSAALPAASDMSCWARAFFCSGVIFFTSFWMARSLIAWFQ